MFEALAERYNELVDNSNALEKAIEEICDSETQRKIIERKKEIQSQMRKEGAKAK